MQISSTSMATDFSGPEGTMWILQEKKQIQQYIKNRLAKDQIADQMSIKEYVDPFTGCKNKWA